MNGYFSIISTGAERGLYYGAFLWQIASLLHKDLNSSVQVKMLTLHLQHNVVCLGTVPGGWKWKAYVQLWQDSIWFHFLF